MLPTGTGTEEVKWQANPQFPTRCEPSKQEGTEATPDVCVSRTLRPKPGISVQKPDNYVQNNSIF